ncbi:glucosamine--fructose-6-phosphate aminotransferase (isomerizing) [Rhizobium leguminosarum]|uniref:Glucosamine--fructose-6-phosphate aminotransferase (Isomerizing) n=2 Tax=Rhizobium leguminosarum TaxID=384 RepID=A0A7W9ZN93_RHILE|nr:SIS domain-containing protein [Rhizobium leguminosarum]ACI58006.1 sugar isomerase (SIS) [Rhizobium leguminosarum bv. trifolii WSM2304]MBB5663682.1 glucosamine--fructose-6-phosphate aminotransferase (isomerizing) [Rhizobium leguminosarum]MBB6219811.1 glucosamine--fructose-6-phosphate aminotransferase (isomerizing) [Rhizobium leguminosarum]NYJ13260.1 glucosamine--fructose-6-phosphate aminotransferase (isomerizing) [Rhizobium leguminosarum]
MNTTEKVIREQFPFWEKALSLNTTTTRDAVLVYVGCGTSYYLAMSLAAYANGAGRRAIAVPGAEWLNRAAFFWPDWKNTHVVAISRSGETTETVAAARNSQANGAFVTALTVEADSSLAKAADAVVASATHAEEGIVMTASASLMLLLGLQMIGSHIPASIVSSAKVLAEKLDAALDKNVLRRNHFVFLGGGPLFGIASEGALKLMEMSQVLTQPFHPLEYRHGPISLVDENTAAVMLYSTDQKDAETKLVDELRDKGAVVIGIGGPGDIELAVDFDLSLAGLALLPALQILGERVAQSRGIDTVEPRHLTKVVKLA